MLGTLKRVVLTVMGKSAEGLKARPCARKGQTCHMWMGLTSHCQGLARRNELFEMDICRR
jgi:hypothetical protein